MYCNFVEIGTSDFDTCIEHANNETIGFSIEPIPCYFKNLPDKPGVTKLNIGISDVNSKMNFFYVDPASITEFGLPYWMKGCNSIEKEHPTTKKVLESLGLLHLIQKVEIEILSFETFVLRFDIKRIEFLKIDTEGHDCVILENVLSTIEKKIIDPPKRIVFESNELSDFHKVSLCIRKFQKIGYQAFRGPEDTTLLFNENFDTKHPMVVSGKKLRIAMITEMSWAYGRIAKNVQKYSRHTIDLFPWSTPYDCTSFVSYDLLWIPEWDSKMILSGLSSLPFKLICGAHSLV